MNLCFNLHYTLLLLIRFLSHHLYHHHFDLHYTLLLLIPEILERSERTIEDLHYTLLLLIHMHQAHSLLPD